MKKNILLILIIFFTILLSSTVSIAESDEQETIQYREGKATELPWAVFGYWGRMTNETFGAVLGLNYTLNEETLYSIEFTRVLRPQNAFRRFLQPFVSTVELNLNFTYRDDPNGPIYEVNPYFTTRWDNFPWNKYIVTSIAVGEGISYDSRVPTIEMEDDSQDANKILNFMIVEVTFAAPKHPNLELVARAHHRSGVFGLYNSENSGSTAVGLGLRYRF